MSRQRMRVYNERAQEQASAEGYCSFSPGKHIDFDGLSAVHYSLKLALDQGAQATGLFPICERIAEYLFDTSQAKLRFTHLLFSCAKDLPELLPLEELKVEPYQPEPALVQLPFVPVNAFIVALWATECTELPSIMGYGEYWTLADGFFRPGLIRHASGWCMMPREVFATIRWVCFGRFLSAQDMAYLKTNAQLHLAHVSPRDNAVASCIQAVLQQGHEEYLKRVHDEDACSMTRDLSTVSGLDLSTVFSGVTGNISSLHATFDDPFMPPLSPAVALQDNDVQMEDAFAFDKTGDA